MDKLPKPLVIGVAAVLVLLALALAFRAVKSGGGDGDYNKDEIMRAAKERNSKPNQGRIAPPSAQK